MKTVPFSHIDWQVVGLFILWSLWQASVYRSD